MNILAHSMNDRIRKIFCFSGLGADERLFGRLEIKGIDLHAIRYALPTYMETIEEYAVRIAKTLSPTEDDIYMGVSFGGMIAQELARIQKPKRTIIISSLTNSDQLPKLFQKMNSPTMRLLLTKGPRRIVFPLIGWLNGVKFKDDRALLKQMALDTDPRFMRWGMQQLIDWQAPDDIGELVHLHGTRDRMIPYQNVSPTHTIEGGSHFMILDRAEEISEIIEKVVERVA